MPTCTNCGQDNPDRAKFCLNCGTALEAIPTPAGEERKVVSVLFVDLVGFTARSDRADPEDVRATLRPYHSLLKREIERFGGTVEKFIGDAVMAVFGAPVAHEDDPERAVRAALRITEAIGELNEEQPEQELAVRSAVNTGEAVVALNARPERGEGLVAGDVVNTASRLQEVAPVGGIMVGEMTYRSTRHIIEYDALEPVRVKGKTELVPVWAAVGARSRYAVEIERASTPFIGRQGEVALLQQTFGRMLRERAVQLVTMTGEPGVGKSRLTGEFSSWVDDQAELVSWRQGRCLPYGEGITFWALGEIVKAHAGILESDAPDQALAKVTAAVDAVVPEGSDREWLSGRLAPLVGLPAPQVEREESFAAWRSFLEAAALIRPLILLIEDLHWADDAMLEFMEHLVDWSTEAPILLLCTARPELYERRPGWGGGKRNSTTIALSPLTDDETARLVGALLSQAVLPAETQAALMERSGGNPLYAEEFVRMLTDREILERKGRMVRIVEGAEIPVPETVQGLIAARLDTLSSDRKSLLQDAAVVGKVFWAEAVAQMGDRDDRAVREELHELARKELIRPIRRSSMEDKTEYAFWHILIRDVAYGQIPRAARAAKHVAAAEWIEDLAGERVADHAELLAHHFTQALDLSRASGAGQVADIEERARTFLIMAGERAIRLDAPKAASYFNQALTLFPQEHPDRPGVLAKAAEAARVEGRLLDAERGYREAIDAFTAIGDGSGAAGAKVRLADVLAVQGHSDRARDPMAEAIRALESEPPSRGLASAYVLAARQGQWSGMPDETALEYARKALAIAEEVGAREEAVRARQFIGFSRCNLGDRRGIEDLREALRLGLKWGLGVETGFGYLNLGDWVWQLEGPAHGLALMHEGIAFAERRGIRLVAMWTQAETPWTLYELGRWDEVVEVADAVTAWERGRQGSQLQGMALPCKARVLLMSGRTAEAADVMREVLPLAQQVGDLQVLMPALGTGAVVELAGGDTPSAVRLIEQWVDRTRDGSDWLRELNLTDALEVLTAAGEIERARALVGSFEARSAHEEHALVTGGAIVAEAAGEVEEAAKLFSEAADGWRDFGNVVDAGRSLLGAGRCLVGLGRIGEASERLREARDVFVGPGATVLVADADAWLERATALSS